MDRRTDVRHATRVHSSAHSLIAGFFVIVNGICMHSVSAMVSHLLIAFIGIRLVVRDLLATVLLSKRHKLLSNIVKFSGVASSVRPTACQHHRYRGRRRIASVCSQMANAREIYTLFISSDCKLCQLLAAVKIAKKDTIAAVEAGSRLYTKGHYFVE
jgi:hypothetical protein